MREIKFRAWNDSSKEFMKIHEYATFWDDGKLTGIQSYIKLSQYTGLKDKNGKEIYEGDVIKVKTEFYGIFSCEVQFFQGVFGYMNLYCKCIENKKGWDKDYDQVNSGWFLGGFSNLNGDGYAKHENTESIEVIGNIYKNPELI